MLDGLDLRRIARAGLLIALPVSVIGLAACGGGGGGKKVDLEDWVADVCELALDNRDATDEVLTDVDITDKDSTVEGFEAAQEEFENLRDEFDDLGQPDIEGGADVRKAFQETLDESSDILDDVIGEIKDLDDGRNFEDDVNEIFEDFDEDPDLKAKLEDINESDVDDLIDLIEDDADCAAELFDN